MRILSLATLLLLILPLVPAQAQTSHFRQQHIADVIERRDGDLDDLPDVQYEYYVVQDESRLEARLKLYRRFGEENKGLLQLLNRNDLENLQPGDTLVVPTDAALDFRAYSPFPRYYPGGRDIEKLLILDKHVQAFAAYEWGRLRRWGIINTGTDSSPTPAGRFSINWKQPYRVSSLSPPGEPWEMYWVMNIHGPRGIHIHQYALPMGGPASHGCVRLSNPDAQWLYAWTDAWEKPIGDPTSFVEAADYQPDTVVLVLGEDIIGKPSPFVFRPDYPVLKRVRLPDHPYDVPAGSEEQARLDRLRAQSQS